MRKTLATVGLALLLPACEGGRVLTVPGADPPAVPEAPTIDLGVSGDANVTLGATAQVTVTVARVTDFTGGVALSTEGLPGGVTAAFAPPTMPNAAISTSTLTLSATPTAVPGTIPAKVRARAAGVADATVVLLITVSP